MFASRSLAVHFARGLIGIAAFAASVLLFGKHPLLALTALPVAFVALRGCPTCWTIGLVQTLAARGKPSAGVCRDGGCELRAKSE